jgi:hypothetical protein
MVFTLKAISRILNPIDSGAGYISLVAGVTDCTGPTAAFTGSAPWAAIAAADGNPRALSMLVGTDNIDIQTVVRWRIPVPWNHEDHSSRRLRKSEDVLW